MLRLEDGTCLAESNAILWYLAEGTPFLPADPLARALALQWMFFEQYSHEPNVAVARHWLRHVEMSEAQRAQLPAKQEGGRAALAVMERHLGRRHWFGAEAMTIADVALYAYTHVAGEGGFDLSDYPNVTAWLARGGGAARARPDAPGAGGGRLPGRIARVPVPAQDHSADRVASPGVWRGLRTSMAGTPGSPSPRMPGVDRSRRGRKFPRIRRSPNPA